MPEVAEDQKPGLLDLQYCLDVVRRRHIHFLIPLFLGWIVIWGASWVLPVRYKSSTLILVEQPTMPKDYVLPNVSDNLQDRLQSITQQILSRTRLLLIIDQLNLYSGSRKQMRPDEKVELMRKDINIELISRENQITAFNIYYSARDPHVAQQVTGELSKLFISANLEVRQEQSEGTTKFLESQLENARGSLAEQEAQIREFKGEHMGELPSQQASNLQILSGLQSQLGNEQDALNTARQQRTYLQTLINQYRTLQGTTRTADGTPARLPAIEQELDRLKSQLADLSSRYTDSYPDIRNLKTQIAKTEKIRDILISDLKNKSTSDSQANGSALARDPLELSQNSPMLQLQGQLQANGSEIKNREQAVASLAAKIGEYQARLNREPVTEQQMADLTRGYDQSKANYDDLLKKKNQSQMATSMELLQQGERFSVLDPPSLPVKPDFPNRLKFCGMGVGLGLALGVLVAGGFEFMDDRIHSEKEIKNMLPMMMISEIPQILNPSDERSSKRRMLLGWSMALVVGAAILVGYTFNYLHS